MEQLPLRELLGALVRDLILAESNAARATADFIRDAGFEGNGKRNDWGKLRFVRFSYLVRELDEVKVRTIHVPLLSLLPVPILQIQTTEYELFAQVNDVVRVPTTSAASTDISPDLGDSTLDLACEVAPFENTVVEKRGGVPRVRVKLTMKQGDLPAGLITSLRAIEATTSSSTRSNRPFKKR